MKQIRADQRERIEEVLRRGRDASREIDYELIIGDADYTDRIEDIEYGTEDGPGIVLTGSSPLRVPASLEGREIHLRLFVGEVAVTQFRGRMSRPSREDGETSLEAGTGGYWLDKISLDEDLDYDGVDPTVAAYETLAKAPYSAPVIVERAGGKIRRQDRTFKRNDQLSDVLESLVEQAGLEPFDTHENGCVCRSPVSLAEPGEVVWTFVVGEDLDPDDGFSYSRTEEEDYSEVIVYREDDDEITELARAEVVGSSAPAGAIDWIQLGTDTDDEDYDEDTELVEARERASERAYELARGRWEVEMSPPYIHPLLERGDAVKVLQTSIEDVEGEEYEVYREWLVLIEGHSGELPAKAGSYEGRAEIVAEERRLAGGRSAPYGYLPPATEVA